MASEEPGKDDPRRRLEDEILPGYVTGDAWKLFETKFSAVNYP